MDLAILEKQLREASSRLTKISVKNNYHVQEKVIFPEDMNLDQWFFSPELSSLSGTSYFIGLSDENKKLLSFYEAINFFCINIHGEKALLEGLTHRLYESDHSEIDQYLHHFIDEENKHMFLFGNFCQKYAKKIYTDRKINFPKEYAAGEEEFLFYIKVFIFEEIVDYYNLTMGKDVRLEKTCQAINQNHHEDESRHLAFGRVMINYLFHRYKTAWTNQELVKIRQYIASFYQMTWREYYNPDVYKDIGIENPYKVAEEVYASAAARAYRMKVSHNSLQYLLKCEILLEEISL